MSIEQTGGLHDNDYVTKTVKNKRKLQELILALLTPKEVWSLRTAYSRGRETVAELSQRSHCPPVLLYCILTPLSTKTAMKLRMLRLESQIVPLFVRNQGVRKIAKALNLPERTVREYTTELFSAKTCELRPWYFQRAPKPPDPNELVYDEDTLPPTSRLEWQNNQLNEIDEQRKGRCPECGRMMYLPCLPCRLLRDMEQRDIPRAEEFDPTDEEDDIEPDLLFL